MRRAAAQGTLRASRVGSRTLGLADAERDYLRAHWQLITLLRHSLRTEHNVRLAVLYGSLARGDEDAGSDLDLLVSINGDERPCTCSRLGARLRQITGRRVDIALLERVERHAPLLLERALDEGRVLVDRDGQWRELLARAPAIRARATRAHRRQMAAAARAMEEMIGER